MTDIASMSDGDLLKACQVDVKATTWKDGRPTSATIRAHKEMKQAQVEARSRGLRYSRFTGLSSALGYSTRLAAHQDEKAIATASSVSRGAGMPMSVPAAKRAPTAQLKRPTPAPIPQAKYETWAVPAEIAAKGAAAAEGYRMVFEAVSDQLARMSQLPAAKARAGACIHLVASGASDADIRSRLGHEATDSQMAIDAIWSRAIARATGQPVQSVGARSSDVWERAIASAGGRQAPPAKALEPRDAARARMAQILASKQFAGQEEKALKLLTDRGLYGISAKGILTVLDIHAEASGTARSLGRSARSDAIWERARASISATA